MRTWLACLALIVAFPGVGLAQEHLLPGPDGDVIKPGANEPKLRGLWAAAYEDKVVLRAHVHRAFRKEYMIGIRVDGDYAEAFVLEPSANVWESLRFEACKSRIKSLEDAGKEVPQELIEEVKEMKERGVVEFREIKVTRRARPIPEELAGEIRAVWETMLLDARPPKKVIFGDDGDTYNFSALIEGRGELHGHIWSPEESKTARLASLTRNLRDYARGKTELDWLRKKSERARELIMGKDKAQD